MIRHRARQLALLIGCVGASCVVVTASGCDGDDGGVPPLTGDIRDRLVAAPGVADVVETPAPAAPGYRYFTMTIAQPVADDGGESFAQRVTLLYRGDHLPVVLTTTGYDDTIGAVLSEPASILAANQVVIEHRYFGTSRPASIDWSTLTIRNAANDFHRVVETLRPLLGAGAWIGTGHSKGGVAAIAHRRFFPADLDGTIAVGAPRDHLVGDTQYQAHFETLGPADCRQAVRAVQRRTLERRGAMISSAMADGATFDVLGGDAALEAAIAYQEWAFWQASGVAACDDVPDPATATDAGLYSFLRRVNGGWVASDANIEPLRPYFYQCAAELGYPAMPVAHLADLLTTNVNDLAPMVPAGATPSHNPAPLEDVALWLASDAERVILVYGQWDPWRGGALAVAASGDNHVFIAPEANHFASLGQLSEVDRNQLAEVLGGWLDRADGP